MPATSVKVRPPAVAGAFYPAEPDRLRRAIDGAFDSARRDAVGPPPRALIVPHAGYPYSGPVAASGYAALMDRPKPRIDCVVVLGPSHFVPMAGLAVSPADAFDTPLGRIPVDAEALRPLRSLPQVEEADAPHAMEHSVEVQLPFLQVALGEFSLVPLVAGHAAPGEVAEALELLWDEPGTLVVISTDLSHHLDYEAAARCDRRTADAVVGCRPQDIGDRDACGAYGLRGLLLAGSRRGLRTTLLDLRSSGDTAGGRDSVVGYGAFVLG